MQGVSLLLLASLAEAQSCPDYAVYSATQHAPFSSGKHNLSYQRPDPACRTFRSPAVESTIARINSTITDPDLARLFENSYPNTLDTAIRWRGLAAGSTDEELTFVITGDINAMWLRDSANQMQSYLPLLQNSSLNASSMGNDSLASLYRGVINLQSRYLLKSPYCNSFQPPVESGIAPAVNGAASSDVVTPAYSNTSVFECKYELDSLAAFLQISTDYYTATNDLAFFGRYQWVSAVQAVMSVANSMMEPTYAANGAVNKPSYTFTRQTTTGTETLSNKGSGNPVANGTGLIRSAFRPSDDATIYQFLIPANMMFAHYLNTTSAIMRSLSSSNNNANNTALATTMSALSTTIQTGIATHGTVSSPTHGPIYAYEVDGYGSHNTMDDANIPSLLSSRLLSSSPNPIYQATRPRLLSSSTNPYYTTGPVLSAIGGPHDGPGYAWPMASIVRALTSDDAGEIEGELRQLVGSTGGLGLVHESVNGFNGSEYTRPWFSWANGLFGRMVVDLEERMPGGLGGSFQ